MLCASALTLLPCWQGYTGFLPGHGNHFAKTYGNVSKAALAERQANDDPLKWRKFVSYAEFTPPKTPAEGHFIPGYSGNVAGVYGENLFAKTYGKTTLQAVSGDYPKGQIYDTEEQVRLAWSLPPRRGHRSCALWRDDAAPTPHRTLSLSSPARPSSWAPPSAAHAAAERHTPCPARSTRLSPGSAWETTRAIPASRTTSRSAVPRGRAPHRTTSAARRTRRK